MYSGDSPSEARTPTSTPAVTPMLRTVLLCDLVDSTALVERLGDTRAMLVFQRHDQLLLETLEATQGRLIDKADGLLALFERPVQAVDFALRYQRALRLLGVELGLPLKARLGIHVGDVMTWPNSPYAVSAGAKPMEVEGLAKPVAARLMALALPGQILLSGMAQSLAQRAQAELGESAGKVRWLVHGRYRFKGVPAPMIVHEVGEPGYAPFRLPPSGQKGWREIPLWRRPPVLALEVLVVAAVAAVSLWSTFKSEPALAFSERDWVVVGDLSNFTGDPRLEESLDTALRVSLEQSRYVNLIPDLRLREALQRMGRSEQTTVDRAIGSEIALREGARALLLPSVAEVGGRLRVNIEVVDPNTQVTVYAESAEGRGAESALASLDAVGAELREKLGESLGDIAAHGKPLAQVTTANLDALRAYSLAVAANRESRYAEALALYQRALKLDPEFALAQLGLAQLRARNGELSEAKRLALLARQNRERLSQRESLELDAYIARFGSISELLPKYKLWASLYPDSFKAYYGYSLNASFNHNYREALEFLTPALSSKNPSRGNAYFLQGAILLALNRYTDARAAFRQAESMGVAGRKLEFAETYAAERNYPMARRALKSQTQSGLAATDLDLRLDDPVFLLDEGRWTDALASLVELQKIAAPISPLQARALLGEHLSLASYSGQLQPAQWRDYVATESRLLASTDEQERSNAVFPLLAGGWLAARNGDLPTAKAVLSLAKGPATANGEASQIGMLAIVEAELALTENQPEKAIALLRARHNGSELYFSHAVLMRAYAAVGKDANALAEADWLVHERGRAYAEWNHYEMWTAANIVESNLALLSAAELAMKLGQPKLAQQKLAMFLRGWPKAETIPFVAARLHLLRISQASISP